MSSLSLAATGGACLAAVAAQLVPFGARASEFGWVLRLQPEVCTSSVACARKAVTAENLGPPEPRNYRRRRITAAASNASPARPRLPGSGTDLRGVPEK